MFRGYLHFYIPLVRVSCGSDTVGLTERLGSNISHWKFADRELSVGSFRKLTYAHKIVAHNLETTACVFLAVWYTTCNVRRVKSCDRWVNGGLLVTSRTVVDEPTSSSMASSARWRTGNLLHGFERVSVSSKFRNAPVLSLTHSISKCALWESSRDFSGVEKQIVNLETQTCFDSASESRLKVARDLCGDLWLSLFLTCAAW